MINRGLRRRSSNVFLGSKNIFASVETSDIRGVSLSSPLRGSVGCQSVELFSSMGLFSSFDLKETTNAGRMKPCRIRPCDYAETKTDVSIIPPTAHFRIHLP